MTGAVRITGATRLYAIVGDPIAQVRSPEVFTEQFAAKGIDAVLVPVHVPADRFDDVIPALMSLGNLDGLLVTVPFKPRMLKFAHRLGATSQCIGAINALRRETDGSWSGDMFDGAGFVRAALRKGQRLEGRRVTLFGAGGAGSAIACALAEAGVASIDIVDPEPGRGQALVERLRKAFPACALATASARLSNSDMVINASPVGMRPDDGPPGDIGTLTPDTLVGDVVVLNTLTPLVQQAAQAGCAWVNGRDMHAGQIDAIMGFFMRGASPPGAAAN